MINFKINWLFALGFWFLILQVRLFRQYRDIPFSKAILEENKMLFQSLFIITLIMALLTFISLLLFYYKKDKPNKISLWLQENFSWVYLFLKFLDEGKKELYTKWFNRLQKFQHYFVAFTSIFLSNFGFAKFLLFLGIVLPRIIILCCLMTEIYLGHLKYYYYSLILLIIPLIMQFIIYILKDIGPRLYPVVEEFIEFEKMKPTSEDYTVLSNSKHMDEYLARHHIKQKEETSEIQFYYIILKKEYSYYDLDSFIKNFFTPITTISNIMETKFLPVYIKVRLITLFIYFLIQVFCWGYIFFFLI